MRNAIRLTQVNENNLKNISVEIPYYKHTVIAGVSGSGKSTLAYDVIYATAQRKLLDCMSDSEKIFSTKMKKPKVGSMEGLSTTISLKQIRPNHNPRSTIGTFTGIGSYIRSLLAACGQYRCLCCDQTFPPSSLPALLKDMETLAPHSIAEISFPYFFSGKTGMDQQLEILRQKGFREIYAGGQKLSLRNFIQIDANTEFILVVEGRFQIGGISEKNNLNCLKCADRHGDHYISISLNGGDAAGIRKFYEKHGCSQHHLIATTLEASDFSYNNISCACAECMGSGNIKTVHPAKVVKNQKKTLRQGPFFSDVYSMSHPYSYMSLYSLAKHYGFSFDHPYEQLSEEAKDLIMYGSGENQFLLQRPDGYDKTLPNYLAKEGKPVRFQGILRRIEELYQDMLNDPSAPSPAQETFFKTYMHEITCPACGGTRLKKIKNYTLLAGKNYAQLGKMEFSELLIFLEQLPEDEASLDILSALKEQLRLTEEIGLGYLSFDRRVDSLSGGEYQRLRIASQVGSGLVGLTYIIDEPTSGLHGSDNQKILRVIDRLLQKDNTVITIEHDLDIIRAADYIIELGPGAGAQGGNVIAAGTPDELRENPDSLIGKYLLPKVDMILPVESSFSASPDSALPAESPLSKEPDSILPVTSPPPTSFLKNYGSNPGTAFRENNLSIKIFGMQANNLKNIDVEIPLGKITCFTGVSGSGKSSVVYEVLYKAFCANQQNTRILPGKYQQIQGLSQIKNMICIDQSLLTGKSTSIPATYLELFDPIRTLFAESVDDSHEMKHNKSYFSFNSKGACPTCKGKGHLEKYIQYFGEARTVCPECNGAQYIEEVLAVKYHGKNIKQVLDMTFSEASGFFEHEKNICEKTRLVCDLGLGYMQLGQPFQTLSGGEAKRMKLAKEMTRYRNKKNLLYIFDEPTVGLHTKDVERILSVMRRIIESKNTVVVVEHNPVLILNADYIIDLGPDAGKHGGEIVFAGTPAQMLAHAGTKTSDYLRRCLNRSDESFETDGETVGASGQKF